MVSLLSRIFIPDAEQYDRPEVRRRYGVLCGAFGIFLNVLLFGGKFFAGVITGSVAITADAFNNLSDAGSSLITLAGFKLAGMKPDREHPFGHGRSEYVAGLIVSVLIILMGFELVRSSWTKIREPERIETGTAAIVILLLSILIKIYMAIYNYRISRKIQSTAMRATAIDSLSDSVATTVVLLAMCVMSVTGINIDGYCGMAVAFFILWAGYQAAKDTMSPLLGVKPDADFILQIEEIVRKYDMVVGTHDLIVHDYGPGKTMISLHVEVPGDQDIFRLHDMVDNIEMELEEQLHCNCVIHMDPIESNNEIVVEMRKKVAELVTEIDTRLSIHDFRMVPGKTHTNLIYDVVLPQEFQMSDEEIEKLIQEKVREKYPTCYSVIKVEKAYI